MGKDEPAFKIKECSSCPAEIINNGYYCDICSTDNLCESCIRYHESCYDDGDG